MNIPSPRLKVRILVFERCNIIDASGPAAVFGAANEIAGTPDKPAELYDIQFVSPVTGPVTTTAGPALYAAKDIKGAIENIDTLICAGGKGVHAVAQTPSVIRDIRNQAECSRRIVSVCTGAFALAAAGLLDGKRAVTHWSQCGDLADRFPEIDVDPAPIFVRDGNTFTSAGVTAGMDLALALVEEDFGHELALKTAREMVMFMKRPGNQTQFSTHLSAQMASDDKLRSLQLWILENLASDLTIQKMAGHVAMTPRTLHRKFKQATGHSPAKFISSCRVESARRLLEESALPIKTIAYECGFGDEERMRRTFHRHLGVGPDAYRSRFATSHA